VLLVLALMLPLPPAADECTKLGVGHNARRTQPRYQRTLRAFIDLEQAGSDSADAGAHVSWA
jgi:hypothetical protein